MYFLALCFKAVPRGLGMAIYKNIEYNSLPFEAFFDMRPATISELLKTLN